MRVFCIALVLSCLLGIASARAQSSGCATIAASASCSTPVLITHGNGNVMAMAKVSGAGTLALHRYADNQGINELPATNVNGQQVSPVTATCAANTLCAVAALDGIPSRSYVITYTNTSGSTETVTQLLGATNIP